MTKENMIVLGAVALIIIVWVVVRAVMKTAINKGADAIHNARVKAKEEKDPPKAESLADRYKQQTTDDSSKE